jgi:isoleucyl-tRNA synthetase
VQDKIRISFQNNHREVNEAISSFEQYIREETQATDIQMSEIVAGGTTLEIDEFILAAKLEVV